MSKKKSTSKAITITTINLPTDAVKMFSEFSDFKLIIAGDNKTPKNWSLKNSHFLSIEYQKNKFPAFSKLSTENHYSRKNFAYIEAIRSGVNNIYETDDDNFPNSFFPNFIKSETFIDEITAPLAFNIYSQFSKKNVWPRGLPLNLINNKKIKTEKTKIKPLIQQSLADLDPDVDAIYRLILGDEIMFDKNKQFSLAKYTYGPFNSQNTYWEKEVFPLLYLPTTVSNRATDIWRGYIAQRIIWELDSRLLYLSPCVYQKRNPHNYMHDFKDETEVYLHAEELLNLLNSIKLKGNVSEMLIQVYKMLVSEKFIIKRELDAVKEWIRIIKTTSP